MGGIEQENKYDTRYRSRRSEKSFEAFALSFASGLISARNDLAGLTRSSLPGGENSSARPSNSRRHLVFEFKFLGRGANSHSHKSALIGEVAQYAIIMYYKQHGLRFYSTVRHWSVI
jgi:hypothetical protein